MPDKRQDSWHTARMWPLLTLFACGTPEPPPQPEAVIPVATTAPAPPPAGRIGGDPILPKPTVVGGIAAEAVNHALGPHMGTIDGCHEGDKTGKVLVKFTIDAAGNVARTKTQSTSLRHPPTENCIEEAIARVRFPALSGGALAVVHYPFSFE